MTDNEQLLSKKWGTVNDVADILQVNPSTVRRFISQGVLSAVRIGATTLRIDLASLKVQPIGAAA